MGCDSINATYLFVDTVLFASQDIDICNGDLTIGLITSEGRFGKIGKNELKNIETINPHNLSLLNLKENESLTTMVPLIEDSV